MSVELPSPGHSRGGRPFLGSPAHGRPHKHAVSPATRRLGRAARETCADTAEPLGGEAAVCDALSTEFIQKWTLGSTRRRSRSASSPARDLTHCKCVATAELPVPVAATPGPKLIVCASCRQRKALAIGSASRACGRTRKGPNSSCCRGGMALLTHRSMVAGIVLGPSQLLRSQADCARSLRLLSDIFSPNQSPNGRWVCQSLPSIISDRRHEAPKNQYRLRQSLVADRYARQGH